MSKNKDTYREAHIQKKREHPGGLGGSETKRTEYNQMEER